MSFPKAKIHRFNDIQNPTPSPADYDVKLKSRIAGGVTSKCGRFSDLRSPASTSEAGSFISQTSVPPTFRTPNVPKKLKQNTKIKPVELFETNTNNLEALNEKIVECNNKDQYINELEAQIEEMKQQLNDLQVQIATIQEEKARIEGDLIIASEQHEIVIKDIQATLNTEIETLNASQAVLNNKITRMNEESKKLREENENDLKALLENINRLELLQKSQEADYQVIINEKTEELKICKEKLKQAEDHAVVLQEEQKKQIEVKNNSHRLEIEEIQYEMLKVVRELQEQLDQEKQRHMKSLEESRELREKYEQDQTQLKEDYEAKIKQLVENYTEANVLAEIQMKEKYNDMESSWQLKLDDAKQEADAILKECQAIAEYNIIQCEVEKNKAVYNLEEQKKHLEQTLAQNFAIKSERDSMKVQNKTLQIKLDELTTELSETREKFSKELQVQIEATELAEKNRHTYEVTILKTHNTIDALKRRLLNSDRDVEQLKAELEATETSKLVCEEKCDHLIDELQTLTELFDEIRSEKDIVLQKTKQDLVEMEKKLFEKVEHFKVEANQELQCARQKLIQKETELVAVMDHLHDQQKLNLEAQVLISKSKEEIVQLEATCKAMQAQLEVLKGAHGTQDAELKNESTNLKTVIDSMQTRNESLQNQVEELQMKCGEHQSLLDQLKEENEKLRKKVAEQEALIAPFKEHLEAYELEYRALMNQKKDAEKEAKEMGFKYAQMIGHQNQKQKIKHLLDLKTKNDKLSEKNQELENKIRLQSRTIERLNKEISAVVKTPKKHHRSKDDKENMESPNLSLNSSSRHESPNGRLRERN